MDILMAVSGSSDMSARPFAISVLIPAASNCRHARFTVSGVIEPWYVVRSELPRMAILARMWRGVSSLMLRVGPKNSPTRWAPTAP
eukprot:2487514-Prorocentrum_lima.AAC.1